MFIEAPSDNLNTDEVQDLHDGEKRAAQEQAQSSADVTEHSERGVRQHGPMCCVGYICETIQYS